MIISFKIHKSRRFMLNNIKYQCTYLGSREECFMGQYLWLVVKKLKAKQLIKIYTLLKIYPLENLIANPIIHTNNTNFFTPPNYKIINLNINKNLSSQKLKTMQKNKLKIFFLKILKNVFKML